jgi:hypothetical protein
LGQKYFIYVVFETIHKKVILNANLITSIFVPKIMLERVPKLYS